MSRPLKKGLEYFPVNVNIDEDDKFFDLFEEVGTDAGLGIVILLLSQIYKTEGYYMAWNPTAMKKFCRNKRLDSRTVEAAIKALTGAGRSPDNLEDDPPFFDNRLYRSEKILTSASLQSRFFLITDRRKSRNIYREYLLLPYEYGEIQTGFRTEDGKRVPVFESANYVTIDRRQISFSFNISGHLVDNVDNNYVNADNNSVIDDFSCNNQFNVNRSTQSKVKEIGKESKVKERESNKGDFSFVLTITQQIESAVKTWNSFPDLPACSYLPTNIPNLSAVTQKFDTFGLDEITAAINNIGKFYSQINSKFRPKTFHAFIERSLDNWLDRAKPWEQFEDTDSNWLEKALGERMANNG